MKTAEDFFDDAYNHWSKVDNHQNIKEAMIAAMEAYAAQYKNQSQPEKEQEIKRLKIEASNFAYQADRAKQERDKAEHELENLKVLNAQFRHQIIQDSKQVKELEAQLRAAKEVINIAEIVAHAGPENPFWKALSNYKALESSPTEQPEEDKEVQFLEGVINQLDKIIKEEQPEAQKENIFDEVIHNLETHHRLFPEQQNQPQPEKAQEEQSELWKELFRGSAYSRYIIPYAEKHFTITRKHHD